MPPWNHFLSLRINFCHHKSILTLQIQLCRSTSISVTADPSIAKLCDNVPIILEEIWLPGAIFKGLTAERLVEYKGPMYGLFEAEFGTQMIRASEKVRAVAADAAAVSLLGVELGVPLLSVDRVSYTYGDRPVEVRRALYVTGNHHYHNELS